MSLTHQDVARIAKLARINVNEAEIAATSKQLNNIFGLIEQMQAVNTDGIEPMAHPQ
ncbi:Asp-tRNA(Asn)/Glu-tRNA(Gln) amidotransferase subunit GatC, partial [Chromobacterium haemolyticum]